MGTMHAPSPVKLVSGILAVTPGLAAQAREHLEATFGPADGASALIPFDFTDYYSREMGERILRQWISFEKLVEPAELASIKLVTDEAEKRFAGPDGRTVNIDPGYLTLASLVLASTKEFSHRVYLSRGIYAEVTLIYKGKEFTPLPWTYPDYRSAAALAFLRSARERYHGQLKNI